MYSKDYKKLLYIDYPNAIQDYDVEIPESYSYDVPDFVESFEPSAGVPSDMYSLTIGKNVKSINTFIDVDEFNTRSLTVYGYQGSVAEEWAKDKNVKFKALD